jgi:hypothetical protein
LKKLLFVSVIVGLTSLLGCGGDDGPTEPVVPTIITVTAATSATAPARLNVVDPIWNTITPKNIPITVDNFSLAAKRRPNNALAVASSVAVQALVVGDSLYLRLAWDDDSWDRWPGRFEVTSFHEASGWAQFTRDDLAAKEDQAMVFFDGGADFGWDVWNWRMTTTGGGYLAEGAVLDGTTLTVDPGDNDLVILNQDEGFSLPNYMHPEGPSNQSYQLFEADAVTMVVNTDSLTARYGTVWAMGDRVPGWLIDGDYSLQTLAARGGRFDIDSRSRHSSNEYVIVLMRELNTGRATDFNMSDSTTVDVRIGISNNSDFRFNAGSSQQGFSKTFKLNLQ